MTRFRWIRATAASAAAMAVVLLVVAVGAQAAPLKPGMVAGASAKLAPRLQQLATPALRSVPASVQAQRMSLPAAGPGSLIRIGGQVVVTARVSSTAAPVVPALRGAGAQILTVSARYAMITMAVTPADLERIAAVSAVRSVEPELRPLTSVQGGITNSLTSVQGGITNSLTCPWGSVRSEGDTQLGAADARAAFGVDGSGVKVGIISDSFDTSGSAATHWSGDVASGDLPGTGNPCGFTTPVQDLLDPAGGTDEGRGMAQVLHDLAPGAPLAFESGFTSTSFPDAVTALRTTGAKVIADDVTYFNEPFFQDGPNAVAANNAATAGIPFFSSAANSNVIVGGHNVSSWEAPSFRGTPCPSTLASAGYLACMNFDTGSGVSNADAITLGPGGGFNLDTQWNEPWYGVNTDLDVFVLSSTGSILAFSDATNPGGTGTQKPFEDLSYASSSSANQTVYLAIGKWPSAAPGNPRVKYVLMNAFNMLSVQFPTSSGGDVVGPTIFGHNGAPGAMSMAAVPYDDSSHVEDFSSRGPVTHYYGPVTGTTPADPLSSAAVLAKPDAAATDGAATSFFAQLIGGLWRFYGTSESAPHAAAIAALQLQADPTATVDQIYNAEKSTAAAVGFYGADAAGSGLLNAVGAVNALLTSLSPPTAGFGFSPSSPVEGSAVSFDGGGSTDPNPGGSITGYSWSFGDGSPLGAGETASHAFAAGTYTVTLTVTDNYGKTNSVSHTVTVADESPTVSFSPPSGVAGRPVAFSGSGFDPDGIITAYSWSFGDGGSGSGASASHTYFATGTYTVTLTVTDSARQSASISHPVSIGAAPPPPRCVVANVKGKSLSAANKAIRAAHCTVGKVQSAHKPKRKPGKHKKWTLVVGRESPGAGSKRPNGAKVALSLVWKAVKK